MLNKWQTELCGQGWNSLFWDNHDLPRIVSRWGNDGQYRTESAKMLAILLHGMQGTPYIYQGEELGMTNVKYEIEEYRDIETLNMYRERLEKGYTKAEIMESVYAKSRDNARTPMQWSAAQEAGFTEGTPWMRVNPNYQEINAESQRKDPQSIYSCYKRLVGLRKEYPVFVEGRFEMLAKESENIFAYTRDDGKCRLLVVCNFFEEPVDCGLAKEWEGMELLLGNYPERYSDGQKEPFGQDMQQESGVRRESGVQAESGVQQESGVQAEPGELQKSRVQQEAKEWQKREGLLRPYEARMYLKKL